MSSGSCGFNAKQSFSGGIVVSESNTATFPKECTPESVRLAPIMCISSFKKRLNVLFNTSYTVIPFG